MSTVKFKAQIAYEDLYVQPLILAALKARLPKESYVLVDSVDGLDTPLLQILQYESLSFELALSHPERMLLNAYVIRKALIRKHFLAMTVDTWIKKHPESILKSNVQPSYGFELDYAEFLDEALLEAYELRESLEANLEKEPDQQQWWILKPSMSDRAQGIRIFSTLEELTAIFEGWEEEGEEEEEEEEEAEDLAEDVTKAHVSTSSLRHFVVQPYVHPPFLVENPKGVESPKFHIRTYVVAVGALKVYVYRPMLALFAAKAYEPPWSDSDLHRHLTNTCLQGSNPAENSVQEFWALDSTFMSLSDDLKETIFSQICKITGELFEAASRSMLVHFQAIPCSFEIFGLDFLLDSAGQAWLLEVNAFPDFKQTGSELDHVIQGLWEDVMDVAVKPFFEISTLDESKDSSSIVKVLDIDLGRR
jgi:tubulin--tyrosine ligase